MYEGDTYVEALTIDIHPTIVVISCTTAYGPKEKYSIEKKSRFWDFLDKIADDAEKGIFFSQFLANTSTT